MSEFEVNKLVEEISRHIDKLKKDLTKAGMVPKSIDMLLEGNKIINCFYCNTPNMYAIYDSQKYGIYNPDEKGESDFENSMYECGKCNKTYIKQ